MSDAVDVGRLWLDRAYQYADDVRSGKVVACNYVKLAVERWFDDLANGPDRGLYFSEYHAARYFRFVYRYCRHYKGKKAGARIELEQWQCFADANLFGWVRENGMRRFRTGYEEVARKNGKSTRIAAAALFYLLGDGEGGPEVYSAATKKEQAREIFDCSRSMVRKSSELSALCDAQEHKILHGDGKYLPLSRDSKSMDGFNVHAALIDELHAHPNSGIWDVLRSAVGARTQGFGSMSAPSKELLRLVLAELIEHNDPLLTWAMSNVVIDTNPAGDIKPDKSKVAEKIDPAVSTIMGIGLTMGLDPEEDKDAIVSRHLEKHGIRTL